MFYVWMICVFMCSIVISIVCMSCCFGIINNNNNNNYFDLLTSPRVGHTRLCASASCPVTYQTSAEVSWCRTALDPKCPVSLTSLESLQLSVNLSLTTLLPYANTPEVVTQRRRVQFSFKLNIPH